MAHNIAVFNPYMIVAPCYAGKTSAVIGRQNCFVDADCLIGATVGWPPGHWWRGQCSHFLAECTSVLLYHEEWCTRTRRFLLSNFDPYVIDPLGRFTLAVWLPPDHQTRITLGRAERLKAQVPCPTKREAISHASFLATWARKTHTPLIRENELNYESLIELQRSRLSGEFERSSD